MEWYWWIIVGVAVIGLVAFKMWYVPKWLGRQADKKTQNERLMEDDE